mgnify:CR=1 FL=1
MATLTRRAALAAALAFAATAPSALAASENLLVIDGPSAASREFSRADLEALPQHVIETATNFTDGRPVFRGPRLSDALEAAGQKSGERLLLVAANDYKVEIPAEDLDRYGVILAMEMDGAPLTLRNRGPIWLMYPVDTLAKEDREINDKLIWQLVRVEVR